MYENNRNYPKDIAINYLGRKISYGELFVNIDKTAAAFLKAGVKEKEIVTIALPSIPEAIYCVYALNKIGAVANMIHPLAGKEETVNCINEVKSRIVVIFDGAYSTIADSVSETTAECFIVASPGNSLPLQLRLAYSLKVKKPKLDGKIFRTWNSFIGEGRGQALTDCKKDCYSMAVISHTGGTTGDPKGVMCSDYSCNSLMWQLLCNFEFKRQECSLNVLPPFVNYSLLESTMAMLAEGITVALLPKYDPGQFGKYLKKYHPNQILSIPAYWEAILNIPGIEKADMSCLKHLYAGGEAMPTETKESVDTLIQSCGADTKLYVCLGCTEMMAGATIIYDNCYSPGSVGIPMVRINSKIVNPETGEELPYGEEGEICFAGDTMMLGYYANKEATEDIIEVDKNGIRWLHTGDIGYITEEGLIFVTGRIKRIIMTKGDDGQVTKMFPDRIEKAIIANSSVELCCVIGVRDKERINRPKAIVVLNDGVEQSDVTKRNILTACKEALPGYMVPDAIEFRKTLPRTSRGKVDYRALEEDAAKCS